MASVKSIIAGAFAVLAASAFWFFFSEAITLSALTGTSTLFALIFLTLHLLAFSIVLLFAERPIFIAICAALTILPGIYFFGVSLVIGIAAFIYISLAVQAHRNVKREIYNRLQFNSLVLLRYAIPTTLTALSIILATSYYVETSRAPERIAIRDVVPPATATAIIKKVAPLLAAEQNFDAGIFYELMASKTDSLLEPYQRYAPLAFAIGFFLFLRTIAYPFGWLIMGMAGGVVFILRKTGAVVHIEEQAVKERVEWS
jgi:hypothetical protein